MRTATACFRRTVRALPSTRVRSGARGRARLRAVASELHLGRLIRSRARLKGRPHLHIQNVACRQVGRELAHEFVEGVDWSDHANFWEAGYDAVMITDTSFFRNTAYHTAGDTADRLDYQRMAGVVQGVYGAVMSFADEQGAQ